MRLTGRLGSAEVPMTTFKTDDLRADELADLEAKRAWVRDHFSDEKRGDYEKLAGKLKVLDVILGNGWVQPTETIKLQCLGVTFGDALAQELGLTWIAIEDERGRDPGLVIPGTSIQLFPMTSISKRVERGESVDVYELFGDALKTVARLREEQANVAAETQQSAAADERPKASGRS